MTSSLTNVVSLTRYILEHDKHTEKERSDLAILFSQIALACKVTANAVRRAGIESNFGLAGMINAQGEEVKKLDVVADNAFINALTNSKRVCAMASEEQGDAIIVDADLAGEYIVCFDPLDGSSNLDANVSVGSIFGIWKRPAGASGAVTAKDCLQAGKTMLCAGYALYGSATMIVCTTGHGVQGFTLDNSLGEFVLTHPSITIPEQGKIYSINEGNSTKWDESIKQFVNKCKGLIGGGKPYSLRYIGSMVADVHRTMLYGGVFMYPADSSSPNGKLRYLYEVGPLSYIMEQAGGASTTGVTRALDVVPTVIHQRVPCFMGSKNDIESLQEIIKSHQTKAQL